MQLFARGDIEGLRLPEKQARLCFGLAKMTVVHESFDSDKYMWMVQCEFYDFLGRVAEYKFEGTTIGDEPLARRLEYILDALFTMIGTERNEVLIK